MSPPSDLPSTSDFLDNLDFFAIALVVSATIFPGLTLCIPGLLFAVLIAIPIVAVALVVGLAVAVVAAPFVLVRGVRGLLERRTRRSRSRPPTGWRKSPCPCCCVASETTASRPSGSTRPIFGGRYRSLFEDLPPLSVDEDALHALGRPGGPCDLGAASRRRQRLQGRRGVAVLRAVHRPRHHRRSLSARRIAATLPGSATSASRRPTSRASTAPARSARRTCTARTTPRSCCSRRRACDVPRNHEGIALIGDPRNDVHLFTSQIWSRSSTCTTGWSIGCATTASPSRRSSRRRGGRPPGTTST